MEVKINSRTLSLVEGDITEQHTDAIVNAANQHLQLGSGVAGAIRRKGGPSIQRECDDIEYCPVGSAAITGGGTLKAHYVIHAVGPHGSDADADEKLASATSSSLRLAEERNLESIAFPAISTGVFGFPIERCSEIMLSASIKHLNNSETQLQKIVFCLFGNDAYEIFERELHKQLAEI